MIKKIISLTLSVTIVLGSVGTVAHADEKTKDVVLQNEIVTDATSREVAFDTDEVKLLNDVPDIIEEYEVIENEYVARNKEIETNEYTLGFKNANGSSTMRVFAFPVKYTDDEGEERDITLDIKENEAGGYVTENNAVITTFPENEEDGIKLQYEDVDISLIPCESYFVTPLLEENVDDMILGEQSIGLFTANEWEKTATVSMIEKELAKEEAELVEDGAVLLEDGKTVSYQWQDKTSLEYSLTYTGFKEDIVVEEYTGQTEYNFLLHTNGLKVEQIEGSYFLTDEDGNIRATIGDIIIFTADERNNTFGQLECEAVKENEIYKMIIKVDADYLKDEKTVYPIRIDPTIEVSYSNNGAGGIQDVTINSSAGSNGSATILTVGKRNTYGKSRALMKFPGLDLSTLKTYNMITRATVEIRDLMCEEEGMAMECYGFTGNSWSESTATWANVNPTSLGKSCGSKTISYANGVKQSTSHRYKYYITNVVQGWKRGTYSQSKGIIFKASDAVENGTSELYKTFASYNRSSNRPSLTVLIANVATQIELRTPYNNSTLTMEANYIYPIRLTITAADQYSIWTTGNLATRVYVYSDAARTNKIVEDRYSGHGSNCCVTLELAAGTYYLEIQGDSATVQGTYGLRVYRGLPMSGSEKPNNFSIYNSSTYIYYNNCYTYALNTWINPISGSKYRINGSNPGEMAGDAIVKSDLSDAVTAKAAIIAAVKKDCIAWGGTSSDFYEVEESDMVPSGYYKVALVLEPEVDYHWYRHVSDLSGRWGHKPGTLSARQYDAIQNDIYVPFSSETGDYTELLGYFALKPPTISATSIASADYSMYNKDYYTSDVEQYLQNNKIYLTDFASLKMGVTTRNYVESVVGEAHETYGEGYIGEKYYTDDGYEVVVYYFHGAANYADNTIEQVMVINADGSNNVIVG